MSSFPIRDQVNDHLLTPQNAAVLIIDFQPIQVNSINSMSRAQLVANITIIAELTKGYQLPVVLSTVNVKTGINKETISPIKNVLSYTESFDRTTVNAWEDKEFNEAVKNTGRKNSLLMLCGRRCVLHFLPWMH